jgi:hypothetical protein
MAQNGHLGLSLFILKAESCETGMDQLRDGFGEADEEKWNTEYLPMFGDTSLVVR